MDIDKTLNRSSADASRYGVGRRWALICGACFLVRFPEAHAAGAGSCCLTEQQMVSVLAESRARFGPPLSVESWIEFSGNLQFDKALGRQLVRLARTFSVRPGFAYTDGYYGMNAAASSLTRVPQSQGTVAFGIHLLRRLLAHGEGGDIAVLGVCAHEFAHIHQFFSDDYWSLSSAHPTTKLVELHADYLAGYFIAQIKHDRPHVNLQKFGDFLFHAGSYDFGHPEFHGTPHERIRAAEEGFRLASRQDSFAVAARLARAFILQNFR